MSTEIIINKESASDIDQVRKVNIAAFGRNDEARLVDRLRNTGIPYISLTAIKEHEVIGHILFTRVELSGYEGELNLTGLGPMAVRPEYQGFGIGTRLVKHGLSECNNSDSDAVVVLGHPEYYQRFGFVPSASYGIHSEFEVPSEAFMILELKPAVLTGKMGVIKYHELFNSV